VDRGDAGVAVSRHPSRGTMTILNTPLEMKTTTGVALDIQLESTPGAGSVWSTAGAPTGCRLDEGDSHQIGAGFGGTAKQHFSFVADHPGHYTLNFELGRSWESTVRAKQPIHVEVS
jgi:hypothetical protein